MKSLKLLYSRKSLKNTTSQEVIQTLSAQIELKLVAPNFNSKGTYTVVKSGYWLSARLLLLKIDAHIDASKWEQPSAFFLQTAVLINEKH